MTQEQEKVLKKLLLLPVPGTIDQLHQLITFAFETGVKVGAGETADDVQSMREILWGGAWESASAAVQRSIDAAKENVSEVL